MAIDRNERFDVIVVGAGPAGGVTFGGAACEGVGH